jgi:exodeoxyribonuclease VII small subunit
MTFEQALSKLDETVRSLESGGLPLAETTRLYERGMKLARLCTERLADAELKIRQIETAYGEQMKMMPRESGGPEGDR